MALFCSIQTMSCKLLLNLVDCIRQRSETEGVGGAQPQGRQLLMRILEVFVLKFKTISKLQLPALMNKWYDYLVCFIIIFLQWGRHNRFTLFSVIRHISTLYLL